MLLHLYQGQSFAWVDYQYLIQQHLDFNREPCGINEIGFFYFDEQLYHGGFCENAGVEEGGKEGRDEVRYK